MKEKIIILVILLVLAVVGASLYYIKPPQMKIETEKVEEKNNVVATTSLKNVVEKDTIVSYRTSPIWGDYLTDSRGRTLYVFSDDKNLESTCSGECLKKWPVFEFENAKSVGSSSDELSKKVNVLTRPQDRFMQYTFLQKPLYYYIGDTKPGDINGVSKEDIGSKWSIVKVIIQ